MSDEERLKKQNELRQAWYEMRKRAEPPPTSTRPTCEAPLDLKTKRSNPNSQQSTSGNNCIEILDDKIIHNHAAYVPPNVYIENNYYEPISPPESTNIDCHEPNTTTDPIMETATAEQDLTEKPIEEYYVISHDQYLEYQMLKRRLENTQDETTEGAKDTIKSGNNDAQEQEEIPSIREKRIRELIGMSDENKNFILSLLNKGQQVNAKVTANPSQANVHLVSGGINTTPAHVPIGIQNNPLLNVRNEWQNLRTLVDVDAMIYSKVPYVSQVPRRDYHQNEQEAVSTKINQIYTFIPSGPQQFVPHTYAQQSLPNTFGISTQRFPGPTTQSDRQHIYPDTDEPNYCQQRWNNPFTPANKHQTYIQKVVPSGQTQAYPENEINPLIPITQRKPNPVVLRCQHPVKHNIAGDRITYPDRIVLNNQQQICPEPVERSAQYSAPIVLNNYPPQRYEEPVMLSDHQVYPEGIVPNSQQKYNERVNQSSRERRQYYEQHIPGQQQIHSNASQNVEQNIKYHDPYVMQNHQQIYLKEIEKRSQEQIYHGVLSESPQRYHNPTPTNKHPTHPTVMNSQPYRYPIPPAPYAQQHAYPEPTATCTEPNTQPKRQHQKQKETTQRQHPASRMRYQRIRTSPVQPHSIPQVPPEMIRRMQPIATEMATSVQPAPQQMPQCYQQYYNQHHENPQMYIDQNYHHPYPWKE